MVSDTYDSGSERWFYLAMVQLGPVDFLKERVSQNGTAVPKSSPIHKLPAVLNCSAGERHTVL